MRGARGARVIARGAGAGVIARGGKARGARVARGGGGEGGEERESSGFKSRYRILSLEPLPLYSPQVVLLTVSITINILI